MGASFFYSALVVKVGMQICVGPNRERRNTGTGSDIIVLKLKIIKNAEALLKNKIRKPRI